MSLCDRAFRDSIFKREDFNSLIRKIDRHAEFLAAYSQGLAGYAAVYANNKETRAAYITLIAVLPEYQNKYIGISLLKMCEEVAWREGMRIIELEVDLCNEKAIRFYSRNGFYKLRDSEHGSMYMQKRIERDGKSAE